MKEDLGVPERLTDQCGEQPGPTVGATAALANDAEEVSYQIVNPIHRRIRAALYPILEQLHAPIDVLAAIGSWGDTLPEIEIAEMLEGYLASVPVLRDRPQFKIIDGGLKSDGGEAVHTG